MPASDSHNPPDARAQYLDAVAKLKSGEDLVWKAEPRVVAEALNEALNTVRAERDRLRSALRTIASNPYVSDDEFLCQRLAREALEAGER
jgi:hypothetical protein